MNESIAMRLKPPQFLVALFTLQIALWFTILFDVPVARQTIGFVYLTIIPGMTIVRILKLKLRWAETMVFAVGLSLAFLMAVALFINLLSPLIGVSKPLSSFSLILVTSLSVILLSFFYWRRSGKSVPLKIPWKLIAMGLSVGMVVFISVVGALLVSAPPHTNNSVLLVMFVLIAILVVFLVSPRRLLSPELYPIMLYVIGLSLLFHLTLFSNFIVGGDILGEYLNFKLTLSNAFWNPVLASRFSSMLSVTLLPATFSLVLGLEGTWVFKIIYPLLFALVPVGLYCFFRRRFGKKIVFFSVFLFVANQVFYLELPELARQMIGELFFILLFLTIDNRSFAKSTKWFLFTVLSFGLVVSHYALSYLFLFFAFSLWLFSLLNKRDMRVNLAMLALFGVMTFAWDVYVSSAATFNELLAMLSRISTNFTSDFLVPQSRGTLVLQGTGVQGLNTFWHLLGRFSYYSIELLIIVGLITLLIRKRSSFFNDRFNILGVFSMLILLLCIIVPNFSNTLNVTRFFHVTLFFLAPFCIVGGISLLSFVSRKRIRRKYLALIVVLAVLIPFFFFQSDFVYTVTGEETWSWSLAGYRMGNVVLSMEGVIISSEVSGSVWLSMYSNSNIVYVDEYSYGILVYGNIQNYTWLSLGTSMTPSSFLYLNQVDLLTEKINPTRRWVAITSQPGTFNVSQIEPSIAQMETLYSSGSCAIYKVDP